MALFSMASVPGEPRRANLHVPRSGSVPDPNAGPALGPAAGPESLRLVAGVEPIVAATVADLDGRRWTLLPLVWRENAPLCAGRAVYRLGGSTFGVACRQRSAWASGETGYCCRCMSRLVDFGYSEQEN